MNHYIQKMLVLCLLACATPMIGMAGDNANKYKANALSWLWRKLDFSFYRKGTHPRADESYQQQTQEYATKLGVPENERRNLVIYDGSAIMHKDHMGENCGNNAILLNVNQLQHHPKCVTDFIVGHETSHYAYGDRGMRLAMLPIVGGVATIGTHKLLRTLCGHTQSTLKPAHLEMLSFVSGLAYAWLFNKKISQHFERRADRGGVWVSGTAHNMLNCWNEQRARDDNFTKSFDGMHASRAEQVNIFKEVIQEEETARR